jgi:hypothetical protein
MILPWVVAVAALAVAVLALVRARRTAQRLDQLVQMYWELKYQHSELRTEMRQLTGETHRPAVSGVERPAVSGAERPAVSADNPTPRALGDAFVPLTSLRR